jgi:hypothetical protein
MGAPAMKKSFLPAVALSVSIFALSLLASSGANAAASSKGAAKNETYMVIKITDESKTDNKVEYKAIATSQLANEEKRVKDDYTQKMKEWHDLRKTDPNAPAPKKIKIQKIKSDYETQKIAQEYADKLKAEAAGKEAPKTNAKK